MTTVLLGWDIYFLVFPQCTNPKLYHMAVSKFKHSRNAAFAVVDLLVLAVFISLFVIITAATLANARKQDLSTECLNNQRQLVSAWARYAADNEDTLCNNFTIPSILQTILDGKFENWANNIMTWSATGTEGLSVTNINWTRRSVLAPYATRPAEMTKCPADNFLSPAQRHAGWTARLRSYSMNTFMGRADTLPSSLTGRSWAEGGAYRQFLKTADIPNPGMTWVTIEEHPDSINDGFFVNGYSASSWADLPASHHSGAATFSFGDGHVELRKWRSRSSRFPVTFAYPAPRSFDALGRQDFEWYRDRVGYVRLP